MRKAFQLHNEMLLHNLQPSPITYNVLINGLCIYGDLKDADRLFSSLQDQNIGLTKVAYTTLIKAHCAKGDVCKIHEKLMILMVLTIGKNSPLVDLEVHHASLDLLIQSTVHRSGLGFLKSTASSGISRTPCFLLILRENPSWERVAEINGLWLCRDFLSLQQQSSLLSTIENAIDSIGIFLGRLQIEEAIELIRLEDDLQVLSGSMLSTFFSLA
ncbi:putative pentatricopeptide repeat-containing protein [Camellia lanceoleosa]|uniref:Pentatricopeptide repeat-containing protein n=1 Tax=Camellia lanceoleosa TaxID=1840588 RepID=A0ACC0IA57_9ERIC|nr:putative pentatricopeptide repeat-containing protein [Camellia lanceoleosa]